MLYSLWKIYEGLVILDNIFLFVGIGVGVVFNGIRFVFEKVVECRIDFVVVVSFKGVVLSVMGFEEVGIFFGIIYLGGKL